MKNLDIEQQKIKKDSLIFRFSLYGFFVNLKFFEPYLILFLISHNYSLLQIGILFSIREITVNIFEIPSGLFADTYGNRFQLELCFLLYICSFILFYFSYSFFTAAIAVFFFGLGEAFRSGTHKSIILSYLEIKNWKKYKTFVFGITRSYSLIGSATSAVFAVILILLLKSERYLFLISIIPYIMDFSLILSYPKSLDYYQKKTKTSMKAILKKSFGNILKKRNIRKEIFGNAVFEATIKSIKDYIQPILQTMFISFAFLDSLKLSSSDTMKIILGLFYCLVYILSSIGSRRAYILSEKLSSETAMNILYLILPIVILLTSLTYSYTIAIILLYPFIFLSKDLRKPIFIDKMDGNIKTGERATIFSLVSQTTSIAMAILAPLIGFLADQFGIQKMFLILSIFLILIYPLSRLKK